VNNGQVSLVRGEGRIKKAALKVPTLSIIAKEGGQRRREGNIETEVFGLLARLQAEGKKMP